jgi:hypothetical protein
MPMLVDDGWAVSSAVEHRPYKPGVAGSKPAPPTNEIKGFSLYRKEGFQRWCQIGADFESALSVLRDLDDSDPLLTCDLSQVSY